MYTKDQLLFELYRIKQKTSKEISKKIFFRLFGVLISFLSLPIAFIIHILGFRYVNVTTERIGHLAIEPDSLIKDYLLGHNKKYKWVILAPQGKVANSHLLRYWGNYFIIIQSRIGCYLIYHLTLFGLGKKNVTHYINKPIGTQKSFLISTLWNEREPLLTLSDEDLAYGEEKLLQLGVPKSGWFICIHAREGKYSPIDEPIHQHRNSDIYTYVDAIIEVVSRGGYVVRMGSNLTSNLPEIKGLIDYAHSSLRSERLDVCILAKSKFILGDSSGLALVGTIFGVPCALTNMIPITAFGLGCNDLTIHKLCYRENNKVLSAEELRGMGLANSRFHHNYKKLGISFLDNSKEEILELTKEMLSKVDSAPFKKNHKNMNHNYLKPGDYSFGTSSNLGYSFLSKYSYIYSSKIDD